MAKTTKATTKTTVETKKEEVKAPVAKKEEVKAPVAKKEEEKAPAAKKEAAPKKAAAKKEAAPKKETAKKEAAPKKATAKKTDAKVVLQYSNIEVDMAAVVENAKADYVANGGKKTAKDVVVYVKPEEYKAYYVIDGTTGSVNL